MSEPKRFERSDQTMDRLLTLAMDHGGDIGEIKADLRQIKGSVLGLQEAFTEHLGWHLGRQ